MHHQRAYRYRCYPTPSQRQMLARTFGCARFVYNWGLRLRSDAYRERGEHVFYRDTSAAPLSAQTGSSVCLAAGGLLCPTPTSPAPPGQSVPQLL